MRAQKVLRSFPLDGSEDRMVLLSWSIDPEPVQRNVARVDRHGNVIWRAEMPTTRSSDCFNALARDGEGFVARTFSGQSVWIGVNGEVRRMARTSDAA